jgi:CheY-like chemotaxis protein
MKSEDLLSMRPTILIAEDSESDRMLIELGFERAKFPFTLQFVHDGFHATEYLEGVGRYANRAKFPVPVVLLTDLKMPRMDGFELLEWVRRNETWRYLPVIVVTGSSQSDNLSRALNLGANTYVVKDLLMRPPPNLFEAIQRYSTPPTIDPRRVWAHKAKKLAS